jgi:hypothetical protein
MPIPPGLVNTTVMCDLFGHSCFDKIMDQQYRLEDCNCLIDCNALKFTVSEKEVKIDPNDYCTNDSPNGLIAMASKIIFGHNQLLYAYWKLPQMIALNNTDKQGGPVMTNYVGNSCKTMLQ